MASVHRGASARGRPPRGFCGSGGSNLESRSQSGSGRRNAAGIRVRSDTPTTLDGPALNQQVPREGPDTPVAGMHRDAQVPDSGTRIQDRRVGVGSTKSSSGRQRRRLNRWRGSSLGGSPRRLQNSSSVRIVAPARSEVISFGSGRRTGRGGVRPRREVPGFVRAMARRGIPTRPCKASASSTGPSRPGPRGSGATT